MYRVKIKKNKHTDAVSLLSNIILARIIIQINKTKNSPNRIHCVYIYIYSRVWVY